VISSVIVIACFFQIVMSVAADKYDDTVDVVEESDM